VVSKKCVIEVEGIAEIRNSCITLKQGDKLFIHPIVVWDKRTDNKSRNILTNKDCIIVSDGLLIVYNNILVKKLDCKASAASRLDVKVTPDVLIISRANILMNEAGITAIKRKTKIEL
jgi:hypothetical protein